MSKKIALSALALSLFSFNSASADTLFGIYAGAGTWQQEYSGDVVSGVTEVSVEDDLVIDDDSNTLLYVALEHGLPMLPNVRAQHMSWDADGSNVLSRTIEFNGEVFSVNEAVDSTVDMTQSDAVLYYEVLDNVVSLDLGMAVSLFEGEIEVMSSTESAVAEFDEVLPMLYAKARADLPLTGLSVGVEGQGLSYDGNSLLELTAQLAWESDIGLGIEAGWRKVDLELDEFDDIAAANIDVSGPYAAINYHF